MMASRDTGGGGGTGRGSMGIMRGPDPEQILYAGILARGMYFGLLILFITFVLYVSGILDPFIPLAHLSGYWSLNVGEYLEKSGAPNGWSWLSMLKYGDFVNFIGVAVLAGLTIVCYAALLPALIRKGDWIYSILVALEILVLVLAASGIITAGH